MISIIKNLQIILILFFISLNSLANDVIPVDIIADEMQWNDDQKIAYAIGNAIATQGEKKISANKLIVRFRGREMTHQDIGVKVLRRIREDLDTTVKIEQFPKLEGRQMVQVFEIIL